MIRIAGGEWKGHTLLAPATNETRPTSAKLREALFNSLQADCPEARVLDLFSGSGALGFEAFSRGASFLVFVENHPLAQRALLQNIKKFSEKSPEIKKKIKLLSMPVEEAKKKIALHSPFDLVFADPPYGKNLEVKLIKSYPWDRLLSPGALIILESGGEGIRKKLPFLDFDWEKYKLKMLRQKEYGDKCLTTLQYIGEGLNEPL